MSPLLLQLSDPHFGTERPEVMAALAALVAEQRPSLLLLSGDITQRATAAQFAAARAYVERLAVPRLLALPGNHDLPLLNLPLRCAAPYRRYARAFGAPHDAVHEEADLLLLTLNSSRWYRHKNGELSEAQVEAAAERLRRARPGQLRVLALHHPLAAITERDRRENLLRGHAEVLARWADAGADLVLGGHIHLPYLLPLRPGAAARPLWVLQAGTALSRRLRGGLPNSVNLLRIAPGRRALAERWDHDEAAGRFNRVLAQELQPLA
ncbi:metallophosphoesterase [Roseateles sp. DAIF2]|uniref:metallophosphoesterase family protein n=1 Tax=Roseateles sp. DAIF2 TaxID=2714952 RepID=UPI0018A25188|nr:metallophosphoesterase [Roseateles sp. DAIF2]QPF73928.1 metallophosphoesterase [Roseateles sp. DAIF2]